MGIDPVSLALIGTAGVGAVSSLYSGQQQKKMYKMQAQQAEMQATADITDRTRALNEALATQNAMVGASGRRLESVTPLIEGQKKRYSQDVELIKAGASTQAGQAKMAGQAAQTSGVLVAVSSAGQGYLNYSLLSK